MCFEHCPWAWGPSCAYGLPPPPRRLVGAGSVINLDWHLHREVLNELLELLKCDEASRWWLVNHRGIRGSSDELAPSPTCDLRRGSSVWLCLGISHFKRFWQFPTYGINISANEVGNLSRPDDESWANRILVTNPGVHNPSGIANTNNTNVKGSILVSNQNPQMLKSARYR